MSHHRPTSPYTRSHPTSSSLHSASAVGASSAGTAAPPAAAYSQLHTSLDDAHSSDDDDFDPRWTNPAVRAAALAASPSRREGHVPTTTRTGFVPPPSTLQAALQHHHSDTNGGAAAPVRNVWTGDTGGGTSGGSSAFSGIPQPTVDLTGMTEEQRELVEYLQARVDAFERERVDFLQRLDEMSGSSSERHQLRWEVHKKDEQLMELQKALSDAHVFLYEERAQVLKLTAENDRLKIQELEDRQRLEHLLALTQPINQEVTYFRECRPEKLTKLYPGQRDDIYAAQRDLAPTPTAEDEPRRQVLNTSANGSGALSHSASTSYLGGQTARSGRGVSSSMRASSSKKKSGGAHLRPVVRTIYLPNENIDILKQIIASLRAQLQEQHTLFEQRVRALQEDRAIREQEAAEVARKANAHIDELAKELKAVNEMSKMTTRDYLELRHAAQLNERKLKEQASHLSQQHVQLQKHIKDVEGRAARSETELQTENASYVSLFRAQTAATEEDLAIVKAQYAATQDLYEKRIRYLETRLTTCKAKLTTNQQRRALEREGYHTDVALLRQKLRKLEHSLVHFRVGMSGAHDDSALASADGATASPLSASARARGMAQLARTQKRGAKPDSAGSSVIPARVAAQFAIMEDDVAKLQHELTALARKMSSA